MINKNKLQPHVQLAGLQRQTTPAETCPSVMLSCSMGWIRDERWNLFQQPVGSFKASVGVSFHDVTLFHGITIINLYNILQYYSNDWNLWSIAVLRCAPNKAILEESERRQDELVARRAHALQQRAEKVSVFWCLLYVFIIFSYPFHLIILISSHSIRSGVKTHENQIKSLRIEHVGWPVRNFQRSDNGKVMQGDSRWCKVYELSWICWNMPRWEERQKVLRQELVKSRTWMRVSEWGNGCS
jgi:hypothetical protein